MSYPRGRAAQPPHPGITIKNMLTDHDASAKDIYIAYKDFVKQENERRLNGVALNNSQKKLSRIRGMSYQSFSSLFRLARYMRLIEFVRDEPAHFTGKETMYTTNKSKSGEIIAVLMTRRIFRLTDEGKKDDKSWNNFHKAWEKYKLEQSTI
jgi:hypothetical protein